MTMTGIKTSSDRGSPRQGNLFAVVSLVLALVMIGQGVVQAAGIGMSMSMNHQSSLADPAEASLDEHDHHRSHGHGVPSRADVEPVSADDKMAHHAGHGDGHGCCPASVCGSACSEFCSGSGVGVSVTSAALPPLSGASSAVGIESDDPVLARSLGVPFRPPILRRFAAG